MGRFGTSARGDGRRAPRAALAWLLALAPACAAGAAGPAGVHEPAEASGPARALRPIPPDLAAAEAAWRSASDDLDALIWYGRRLGYEERFEESLVVYGTGLERHPGDAELLRHRGHRFLSLRRFEEARADLERAARALEGRPDEVERDGAPNAFGVPRGTLHTNVWYHLGLAYHCLGRDEDAAHAFAQCLAVATNDDFRVAASYWRTVALYHLARADEARTLAALQAGRSLELMESFDYAALLRLFAGTDTGALDELAAGETELARATLSYGVAMWHRMHGRHAEARALLADLVGTEPSAAFGRIAAEVELARMDVARRGNTRP